jgi:hypothetical protein
VKDDWSDTWNWTPEEENQVLRGMNGCGWFAVTLAVAAIALVVLLILFGVSVVDVLNNQE